MHNGFQEKLIHLGTAVGQNIYLSAIKEAFLKMIPFTLIGAIAVLWTNVIVNDSTGLGSVWPGIMALKFLNPMFDTINLVTSGSISLIVAFFVGTEISKSKDCGADSIFCGALGVAAAFSVATLTKTFGDQSVQGYFSDYLGSSGLFSGALVSLLSVTLFCELYKVRKLQIVLPDAVPPNVSSSFRYLIPAFLDLLIVTAVNLILYDTTGYNGADLIGELIQKPFLKVGGSFGGMMLLQFVIVALWSIGMHGDGMLAGIVNPITEALTLSDMDALKAGKAATNIWTTGFDRAFFKCGGCGMVIGLTLAFLIFGKREENRAVAKMAIVPNLFNIGEVAMFGYPVVLNPILMIPFIIAPLASGALGYLLTVIGFCPVFAYEVPWTMPPVMISFIATGGSIRAVISQLLCIALTVLIYAPFVKMYEKSQAQEESAND